MVKYLLRKYFIFVQNDESLSILFAILLFGLLKNKIRFIAFVNLSNKPVWLILQDFKYHIFIVVADRKSGLDTNILVKFVIFE